MTTNINPYQQAMGQPYYMMNPVVAPQVSQPKAAQEVNAVKIELIEPKAYGSAPNEMVAQQPSCFTYPQSSVYVPNGMSYPYVQTQMYPSQFSMMNSSVPQTSMMAPPTSQPVNNTLEMPPVPPAVVDTPDSKPTVPLTYEQVNVVPDAPQPTAAQQQQPIGDVNTTLQELASNNLETQFKAINEIAEKVQSKSPESANFLAVDTFKGLASVVNKDTAGLEAPTQEQTALREKALDGQQLTPEELAKAEQLAPQEMAEQNKQYALYTLAILQNAYRDAVNQELQAQGMQPAKINELPEINLVIDTIKSNPNPLIREAGISAFSYVVRPEDKDIAKTVFTLATQDSDENVKKAASDALAKIGEPVSAPSSTDKTVAVQDEQSAENVKKSKKKK